MSESTAIPDLGPRTLRSSVANPYAGPRPFTADEHRKFAGRDDEISELSSLIVSHQVVLLYAQSGAGKTSLLNAGLTPAQYAGFGALGSCAQLAFSAWFLPNSLVPLLYLRGTILRLAWGMILGLVVAWVYSGREVNARGIAIALATGAVSNVLADQLTRAVDAVRPSSLRETNERGI